MIKNDGQKVAAIDVCIVDKVIVFMHRAATMCIFYDVCVSVCEEMCNWTLSSSSWSLYLRTGAAVPRPGLAAGSRKVERPLSVCLSGYVSGGVVVAVDKGNRLLDFRVV